MENVNTENDQLILISGFSGTGKSASLRNIRNQEKWIYCNCESGKRLPFKNNFKVSKIDDPVKVLQCFDFAIQNPDKVDGIIIDSLTFLMDMYESVYVLRAQNGMKAWSDFQQYFKTLMQDKIVKFNKPVILIAHVMDQLDEKEMAVKTFIPIKGALKGTGVEAYVSTNVAAKKITIKELENYHSDLLNISDEERELGFKYVFQTRLTPKTLGERIRSPMGLFTKEQTYIDNDAQLLLDYLNKYYGE